MNTSDKTDNRRSSDPFDQLIFEQKLRVKQVFIDKELDLLAVALSNGHLIKSRLSEYAPLHKATTDQLNKWRLISGGVGISWDQLNIDLSVKGLIKSAALNSALRNLQARNDDDERLIA